MEGATADISTRDVKVLKRAASMEVGFSVKEDKGTVLTGRKPSVTLFSISENEGLEKVERGLKIINVSGGINVSGINIGGINGDGINVGGMDVSGIDRDGIDVGGMDVGGMDVGGTDTGGIKVGEVKTCGIGVCGAEVYEAKTCVVLKEPSSFFFSTPSIASFSCSSPSFRAFYFRVRFAAFFFSRRFVALLYFFFFIKSLPFKAIAMAGQL